MTNSEHRLLKQALRCCLEGESQKAIILLRRLLAASSPDGKKDDDEGN